MLEQLFRGKRMAEIVEALADKFGVDHALGLTDRNRLFEIFAGYCVTSQYRADFDAEDLHAGQSRDLSVDAYAIIINDVVYTDSADVERVAAKLPQLRVQFVLVQAKRSRKFEGRVFNTMVNDVVHVFSAQPLAFPAGPKARNLRACVAAIYRYPGKFAAGGPPNVAVWYTSLGTFRESNHGARIAAAAADLRRQRQFKDIEVRAAGAHELRNLYHEAESMGLATVKLGERLDLPKMGGVDRAVFGVVSAGELVENVLLDNGVQRPFLFHDNLRGFLGTRGTVNNAIGETLRSPVLRDEFAVLNNGVTILTPEIIDAGDHVVLRDPQIINGCQTCSVLLQEQANLAGVKVGVRIIQTNEAKAIDRIIRATNTQNPLRPDDHRARDGFQWLLEDYFQAQPEDRRLYFERRVKQYGGVTRSRIISRRHLTQSYAAMWLAEPHNVAGYQALLNDHAGDLFHPSHDPLPYYTCAVGLHRLNWLLGLPVATGRRLPPTYRPARFHLLYGMKLHLLGPNALPAKEDDLRAACNRMLAVLWDPAGFKQLVDTLTPAITGAALTDDLAKDVKQEDFTIRFKQNVLGLPGSRRAAA